MPFQHVSGWRKPAPPIDVQIESIDQVSKEDLFKSARLAAEACSLRPAARQLLELLVGCFRNSILDQLLVWPSNEFLVNRTGLSERAVRYALADLISAGLIKSKDSANGKRFAIHARNGQIVDAYGFDLTPLVARSDEFAADVELLKEKRRQRRSDCDEITICRRYVSAIADELQSHELADEVDRLRSMTPRRDGNMPVAHILAMWRSLKEEAERQYHSANGGKFCRHIKSNNDSPDQSCSNGLRDKETIKSEVRISDLQHACPDAFGYTGSINSQEDLLRAAAELRGGFGVHQSAWVEALDAMGSAAAAVFFVALQHFELDQRSKAQIRNFGGYFRSLMRKIASGQIDLRQEIQILRNRRRN